MEASKRNAQRIRLGGECMTSWGARCWAMVALIVFLCIPLAGAETPRPKYIFLMIGDGMGQGQRAVTERYLQGHKDRDARLAMDRMPVRGETSTAPVEDEVTDSAAAGTALACGQKTKKGTLGLSADQKTPLRSITFDARAQGMRVGILTSVALDHATPAAFYAHQPKREMYYEIACELGDSGFDFFAGESFLADGKAKGRRPASELAAGKGYRLLAGREGLSAVFGKTERILWQTPVGFRMERDPKAVQLAELVERAIRHLENPKGFFMMVEGGRLDYSCHANDLAGCIHETLAFDEAVAVACAFHAKHPGETLIVVTADHETGGLALDPEKAPSPEQFAKLVDGQRLAGETIDQRIGAWKKEKITPEKAFAEAIGHFVIEAPNAEERKELEMVIQHSLKVDGAPSEKEIANLYGKKTTVIAACQRIRDRRCGVSWKTRGHTGADVITTALGAGSETFGGKTDNTDTAKAIRALILAPAAR